VEGSKVSQAVALFEKGSTMKTVKEKTGGPQNNVLKKLAKDGHKVERYDGMIKVTHKDDIKGGGKKSSKSEDKDEAPAKSSKKSSEEKSSKKSSKDEAPAKSKRRVRDDD
jgi:hypothetical protein